MTRTAARILLVFTLVAVLVIFATLAFAHSWYPLECCSERDCFPVPAEHVRIVPGGYALADGTVIPYREARPSPDGQFHVCRFQDGKGALIRLPGKPPCFWAPVQGS